MYCRSKPPIWGTVAVLVVILIVSGFNSRGELNYLTRGRAVTAEVLSATEYDDGQFHPRGRLRRKVVEYQYTDDTGRPQVARDLTRLYWKFEGPGTTRVEYIPGRPGSSRLLGNGDKIFPSLFFGSLAGLALVGGVLALEVRTSRRAPRVGESLEDEIV